MLTKTLELGSIEILADRRMQVREDVVIYEDEKELSRTYSRYIVSPGDDVCQRPQLIQDLAELLWTPTVMVQWITKKLHDVPFPPHSSPPEE